MLSKRILVLVSLLLVSFLLVGCFIARNEAPIITSDPTTVAIVGVEYTYDVEATDPEEDVLTYSLIVSPEGMGIVSDTGLINWIPTEGQVGHHDVIVEVSDGWNEITQTFGIVVKAVELDRIVVDPKTMILLLPESSQPFTVTAYYNDGTNEEIGWADYSYDLNPMGIVVVWDSLNFGWVTAVAEGTATITVSYGDKSDSLEVTVTYLPMEIIADMPTFTVDIMSDFTVEIVANSDVGKNVIFYFTIPTWPPSGNVILYYNDVTAEWETLTAGGTYIFGGTGFPLNDEVMLFKGVFHEVGTYSTTVKVWTVTGNYPNEDKVDLLCNKDISAVVKPVLLDHIVVEPGEMNLNYAYWKLIDSVTAHYDDTSTKNIPLGECTFTSDNPSIATVTPWLIEGKKVVATGVGIATITVSYTEGDITKTDEIEVTVNTSS